MFLDGFNIVNRRIGSGAPLGCSRFGYGARTRKGASTFLTRRVQNSYSIDVDSFRQLGNRLSGTNFGRVHLCSIVGECNLRCSGFLPNDMTAVAEGE